MRRVEARGRFPLLTKPMNSQAEGTERANIADKCGGHVRLSLSLSSCKLDSLNQMGQVKNVHINRTSQEESSFRNYGDADSDQQLAARTKSQHANTQQKTLTVNRNYTAVESTLKLTLD